MPQIISSADHVLFSSLHQQTGWRNHVLAAWSIDEKSGKATPVVFPEVQPGAVLYARFGGSDHNLVRVSDGEVFDKSALTREWQARASKVEEAA